VLYGPFGTSYVAVAASIAVLVVGVLLLCAARNEPTLSCAGGPAGVCRFVGSGGDVSFPRSRLRAVHLEPLMLSGAGSRTLVVLELEGEARAAVAPDSMAARRIASAIDAGRTSDRPFATPMMAWNWWMLGVAVLFLLGGITALGEALASGGGFVLEVPSDGTCLRVRRRVLGVALAARRLPIDDVADVEVERADLAPESARLVLVRRSGEREALSERPFPGIALHERAAEELRSVIALAGWAFRRA
jgi:hypothetical protein